MVLAAPSRRRTIEDAASVLFRARGYAATSVRDIARVLEIEAASLYAHVASKEDVLWAIVDRAASAFEDAADRAAAGVASSAGAPERIAALVRSHVHVIASDPELAGVFVHEWRHLSEERRSTVLARRDAYETRLRDLIRQGMADGQLLPTDPAVAASFILTALNGIATWYRPDGRLTADRLADHYVGFAVRALSEEAP